jgi:tricorn protease
MKTLQRLTVGSVCALALVALLVPQVASAQTKLLRFPDIHGDQVAFVYAGDIWLAPASGGMATRLTTHPGLEVFPKFSPDGQWIAFTGQYDGDEQVYVVPTSGGVPQQLTYYPARGPMSPRWGYDNIVYGWTPDGDILVRSLRGTWDIGDGRLYRVSPEGGLPEALPMPVAGAGDLSPDGRRIVYSPLWRDFRSWKRYEGGWAQELYIFDLQSYESQQITDDPRADRDPMWIGDMIYFTSDRDGTNNLYSYDVSSGATTQVTRSTVWDVRWPSSDNQGRIVYESNGELVVFDVASGNATPISINVVTDGVAMRPALISVEDNIEGGGLSPKAERAVIVARGDIFTVPIEHGATRNLTRSPGAHEKNAAWSPDGSKIAFVSDMSGEEQLYVMNQDGTGEPEQLTRNNVGTLFTPNWSPDGTQIAYSNKTGKLFVVDVESKRTTEIADEPQGFLNNHAWSPRGGYIAYTMSDPSGFGSVHIYSMAEGRSYRATNEMFNDFDFAWDPDGNYLYYLSDRSLAPQIGSFEFNYVVDRETWIYALALRDDVPHPFPPRSDEVTVDGAEDGDDNGNGEDEEGPIGIDFDGLEQRVARFPIGQGNYGGLGAVSGKILYVEGTPFYYGASSGQSPSIMIFDIEEREESTVLEEVGNYSLSQDGKKMAVYQGGGISVYDVKANTSSSRQRIPTSGLQVDWIPAVEWEAVFDEVWRRFRDYFYVANMHGYDWEALREQYRPQLEWVAHRSDLNYVLSEMVSELAVGHAYIQGGEWYTPDRPRVALLGAEIELDDGSGRYRITTIYDGDNQEDRYRSPLTEIGVDVSAGDYILAINGEPLQAPANPFRMLQGKSGSPLTLTVNSRPSMDGAREVMVNPITSETSLRYFNWVESKRRYVAERTDGRVGYMHLPDMGSDGIREFIKWYYPQIRKEGMVIDVRGNGGGNVSQMLIRRLMIPLLGTGFARNSDVAGTYPGTVFIGHMVCLMNETSASDGDIFPWAFKRAGLGPVIGKRSWGGVVGISGRGPLIDGATVFVPEFSNNDADGSYSVEGYGVDPDIEVDNTPRSIIEGQDLQLDRGIAEVMDAIRREPVGLPERPADPVKTKQ